MNSRSFLPFLLLSTCGAPWVFAAPPRPTLCPPSLPSDICEQETKIYLNTDFHDTEAVRAAAVGVKNLLIAHSSDSESIRTHLLDLMDQVIERDHQVRSADAILKEATGEPNLGGIYDELQEYYKTHGPIVPLDWSLPDDFKYFVVDVDRNGDNDGQTYFSMGVFAWAKTACDRANSSHSISGPGRVGHQAGIGHVGKDACLQVTATGTP